MTEAIPKEQGVASLSGLWPALRDPVVRLRNVDRLAVLIAILLPWSTTGVGIAVVLWLIAFVPTVEPRALWRSLARPASALPLAFVGLALVGTLWSDGAWHERSHVLGQVAKLLVLPLLIYLFQRSPRGVWVFVAFLVSCTLLAVASGIAFLDPNLSAKLYFSRGPYLPIKGVFVKNYIDQGQAFSLCAVALAYPVLTLLQTKRIKLALLLAATALALVANMIFVVTSRTALVTMPVMLVVFALLHLRWRVAVAALCATALVVAALWSMSPILRATVGKFVADYQQSEELNNISGMGSRLEYWRKSRSFIADAPLIGHGTGATRGLFERAATGVKGPSSEVVSDPHNQTLNVAVQWGAFGVVVLYAMWIAHLKLFRGEGLPSWIGLLVVIQNVLTSLFNSHLFDFVEGWMYVLGVGVAAGLTLGTLGRTEAVPEQAHAGQKQ
jgi:O-antigen ligase